MNYRLAATVYLGGQKSAPKNLGMPLTPLPLSGNARI